MEGVEEILELAKAAEKTVAIFVESEGATRYGTTHATIHLIHTVAGEDNKDKIIIYVVPESSKNALLGTLCQETGNVDTELPVVYIGGELIGGSKVIYSLHLQGRLAQILEEVNSA